ncbi:GNAT family N-acetyltransferase [Altererythrobacter sp. Root672]|uniref:GNAT family N-acetyltransferase n=1 Tax=Altererythrobacter sp. Root672 TaxID=1736584 RepID=UPI0006F67A63|nr:GNAT family N-acetyltransferase [Altererythrobacter sp. Root672]KRA81600.1 hypothetical protein ASD76_13810 [Altererythrobacter sp. Root672]
MIDLGLPGGMEALVRGWELLQPQATLPTQGADFVAALGRTLLADTPIKLIEAKEADETVAVLPLCHGRGPFARWRLPGAAEVFEPGDALCRDSRSAQTLAQFLSRQARAVELHRVPANSSLIPALRAAMKGRGWVSVRPATACPYILLDASWTDAERRFSARRRSDFRRAERRAAEFGQVTCEILSPNPAEFDALFDEAVAVEARSWKTEAGTAIASEPVKEEFFRSYFQAACDRGEFRVAFLRIDGKAIAMQLAVEWAGRYWLYKIGYDEAYGRCSPGTLLMLHCLGRAAGQGLVSFELLGDAEAWIADFWTREQHECRRVRTYPLSLSGLTALLADGYVWMWGRLRPSAA